MLLEYYLDKLRVSEAVPWFKRSVTGLYAWRSWFDLWPVHIFVVEKWHWDRVFSVYFTLSVSFH